jgi:hypothetical protein
MWRQVAGWKCFCRFFARLENTGVPHDPLIQYPRFTAARKILKNERNKQFIKFTTPAKQERTITWWNLAAQTRPVLNSSSVAPVHMLPRRTFLHSASSVLAVCIIWRVIAVFVFRKPLSINKRNLFMFVTLISRYIYRSFFIRGFT